MISATVSRHSDVEATVPLVERVTRSSAAQKWGSRISLTALVLIVGYLGVVPLIRLQGLAVENGGEAYSQAMDVRDIRSVLLTTLWLALGSVVIAVVLGTALAWMSIRLPRRWQWLANVPILPVVIPAVASFTGWVFLLSPGPGYLNQGLRHLPWVDENAPGPINVYSERWIIILVGFSLASMVYLFVRAGLRNLDQELLEAAYTTGLSSTAAFFKIGLPILRPTLVYGASTALLLGLGQVAAPLILGTRNGVRVLTTEVYSATSQEPANFGLAAALASPLLIAGFLVVILQRVLLGNPARFVSRSGKSSRASVKPSRWAAPLIGVYGLLAIVLPLCALIMVSLSPFWSPQLPKTLTLQHFRDIFANPTVTSSINNSVVISLISMAIGLPLAFLVATAILNGRKSFMRPMLEVFTNIPLGIPAVVYGVGFLFTYSHAPFVLYGTKWVVVVVYVTLMLPFAVRFQLAGLIALGPQYEEAARVSGRGLLMTKIGIVVPLMRSSIGGAAAIMFVLMTHEFSASLLVRSGDVQVMGTKLYDMYILGGYPNVAALALVMCAITGAGVIVAMLAAGRDVVESL